MISFNFLLIYGLRVLQKGQNVLRALVNMSKSEIWRLQVWGRESFYVHAHGPHFVIITGMHILTHIILCAHIMVRAINAIWQNFNW